MGAPPLDEREIKFLPDAAAAHFFWAIASQHLRPQAGPGIYTYSRTTYFDTADLALCRSQGHRVRVREYSRPGDDAAPELAARCYLERKRSSDGLRSKSRIALRPEQVDDALCQVSDEPLWPCVTTWYRRQALVDPARGLRVTLDDHVLSCRPRPLGAPFADPLAADILAEGPAFVLEYKARSAPPAWLTRALAELPEAVGFSKFLLGMRALANASARATAACA